MSHPITPENVTRTVLPNGIVVLVKENHTNASVSLRGRMRAGGLYETEATAGLAQFTAASLQRGTRKFTFQKLNELYDRAGMSFGTSAATESAGFGGKALVEDFEQLLVIAEQVLRYPTFPSGEVNKLRGQIVTSLREAQDDTRYVAYKKFRELCFPPDHPFHRTSDGTEATVRNLTTTQLANFHDKYYRPDGTVFVVVGDIAAEKAVALIAKHFSSWKGVAGLPFDIPDAPLPPKAMRQDIAMEGKSQADIVIGYPGIRRNDPDYYPLRLGDLIFGQLGLYGRLGEIVRDKMGLCYYVYSGLDAGIGAGPWTIGAGVNPRNVELAIQAIEDEVRRLRMEGVTANELAHAQDYLTGSLAVRLETNDGVGNTLADIELYGLGLDYIERFETIFRSITRDQILAALAQHTNLENAVTVVAGPGEAQA